jgi:hypothetical protein
MRGFVACAFLLYAALAGAADVLRDATINAWRAESIIHVEASFHVDVSPALAWRVMTDYEHMAGFVPTMTESRVLGAANGRLTVYQKGVASLAWFSHDWEMEREITLEPEIAIHSHALRGNVKRMEMQTHLTPEGDGVRIRYQALTLPDFWVPPLIGPALMKSQVTEQFSALAAEMHRRAAAAPGPAGR